MSIYFVTGLIRNVGYNLIDLENNCRMVVSEEDLQKVVCNGLVENVKKQGKGLSGVYMSLKQLPIVGETDKRVVLYTIKEKQRVLYVHSNADATNIDTITNAGIHNDFDRFVNVSKFLSGSHDIVSKIGLPFPKYDDIMASFEMKKRKGKVSDVAIDVPRSQLDDNVVDLSTNTAYIRAYLNRKVKIKSLNETADETVNETDDVSVLECDSDNVVNVLQGFDIAKSKHDAYIQSLNK